MTMIGCLRLRTARQGASRIALRSEAEQWLAAADLRPPGLPTGAVLVVRHLGGLPLVKSRGGGAPGAQAARARMDQLYRMAARPIRSAVPATAQSVLFADEAEVLVCFTRDLLNQSVGARWYWRYVTVGSGTQLACPARAAPGSQLAAAWSAAPEGLPAALAHLTDAELGAALAALTPREVAGVVHALHRVFALPAAIFAVTVPARADAAPPARPAARPFDPAARSNAHLEHGEDAPLTPPPAPWERWFATASLRTLPPQARYLAGLSAALYHAPTWARSDAFARRAAAWLAAALAEWDAGRMASPAPQLPSLTPLQRPPPPSPPATTAAPATPLGPPALRAPFQTGDCCPQCGQQKAPGVLPGTNAPPAASRPGDTPSAPAAEGDLRQDAASREVMQVDLPRTGEGVWTALAGVFYLMHTLPWLALPGQWAAYLSAWTILDLLARALLPADTDEDDVVWRLLAAFDQRDPCSPLGAALPDDADFALSAEELALAPAWVQRLAHHEAHEDHEGGGREEEFFVASSCLRGCISHHEGRKGEGAQRVVEGRSIFVSSSCLRGCIQSAADRMSRNAARWLAHRAGFYRLLLQRALGNEAPEAMLRVRGQISVSHTHLDLYLPAHAVNLAVRRAGLDANPGWLPDFGYIVLFHFVEEPENRR
jgi:hypothetical protein